MKEKKFLIVALVWSLIGLFALLLLANFAKPPTLSIADLEQNIGKIVQLNNVSINSISYSKDAVFLELKDFSGEIKAVYFGRPKYEIIVGDIVAIKGKVQLYKGDCEIVIQELTCLSCK
jgi:RecJ-like exonuclease